MTPSDLDFIWRQEWDGTSVEWPGGSSGVTIGGWCDLGQHTAAQITTMWQGTVPDLTLSRMLSWCGRSGPACTQIVAGARDIVIPEAVSRSVFEASLLAPGGYVDQTRGAFPGCDALPATACLVALVDLVFNRGPSMIDQPGALTRVHMRAIRDDVANQAWAAIPDQFRLMATLWPVGGDLYRRRLAEADLFASGIS